MDRQRNLVVSLLIFVLNAGAYEGLFTQDSLLFSVHLLPGDSGLLGCHAGQESGNTLRGPCVMQNNSLLFHSRRGYLLYDKNGSLLDSKQAPLVAGKRGETERLLYPLDHSSILYLRESGTGKNPEFFRKQLFSGKTRKLRNSIHHELGLAADGQPFNICFGSASDDLRQRFLIKSHLVGFESFENGGRKWWGIEKNLRFTAPVILEEDGTMRSVFTGLHHPRMHGSTAHYIDHFATFCSQNTWYHYGICASPGPTPRMSSWVLYLSDAAGNVLRTDTILREILGTDDSSLVTTPLSVKAYAFQPAIDNEGDIYYGILRYDRAVIDVFARYLQRYWAVQINPAVEQLEMIDRQQAYKPDRASLEFPVLRRGSASPSLPGVIISENRNTVRTASVRDLRVKGYLVRIARAARRDLAKKLATPQRDLPPKIRELQQSLFADPTAEYPFVISLSHVQKGSIARLYYGLGDRIVSARVLNVADSAIVAVRVDLVRRAEILLFSETGKYINRFEFNRRHVAMRRDIVAMSDEGTIIERDYELSNLNFKHLRWTPLRQEPFVAAACAPE